MVEVGEAPPGVRSKNSVGSRIFAEVGGFRLRVSRFSSRGAFGAEKDPVPTLPLWGRRFRPPLAVSLATIRLSHRQEFGPRRAPLPAHEFWYFRSSSVEMGLVVTSLHDFLLTGQVSAMLNL